MALPAALPLEPKDPGYGTIYGPPDRPAYVTREGIAVWMWRKGQHVRFYDARAKQHGPEHGNVVPAVCWAAGQGWIDPADPLLSLACTAEVRQMAAERRLPREVQKEVDAGAWCPTVVES